MKQQLAPPADTGKRRGYIRDDARMIGRLLGAAFLVVGSPIMAPAKADSGPFAALAGSWHGTGTVTLDDGSTERLRCQASYAAAGARMDMTLTCASEAYKLALSANVTSDGKAIGGSWSEASRNISGTLRGTGGGNNFQVVASAAGFNATISLATQGNRQSVVMRADSQLKGANITMAR